MNKIREIVAYKHYFEEFLSEQPAKVQDKIFKIIEAIETLERIPQNYLKHIEGTDGLYETSYTNETKTGQSFLKCPIT